MAKSLKQLMGMSEQALIAMGAQHGLTFHEGMKKSHMAAQINQSAASGWMEVNHDLMYGSGLESGEYDEDNISSGMMLEGDAALSDSAQIAQMLHNSGMTETFHEVMNGPSHHVEAVGSYLESLGANVDDVWKHLPKANPNIPAMHFGALNNYLRDKLPEHLTDVMGHLEGHYAGNFMDEYSTNRGGVQESYNYLAHMYVNRDQYTSSEKYQHDISLVSTRLQSQLGGRFKEVAFSTAIGAPTSYLESLPRLGSSDIVKGIAHPREPLNKSGFPMGSVGGGMNTEYSLSASLTGQPHWSDVSKGLRSELAETTKSLAKVYSGESGLSVSRGSAFSDAELVMDSATRYIDAPSARENYALLDNKDYGPSSVFHTINGLDDYESRPTGYAVDPTSRIKNELKNLSDVDLETVGREFTAQLGPAYFSNPAYERREAKRIADLDASHAGFRDTSNYGTGRSSNNSGIQYHDALEQGSQEWLDFRKPFDITGSTVGSYLGNNKYTSPIKEMSDKLGFKTESGSNADMARGHRLEPIARARVAEQFGIDIGETGAITNSAFPRMMYSPDGLIGEDALWEHKAPRKFFDLQDHQDYIDQVQLGMHLSGRSKTLFSQTVGNETRSEWIDKDPTWFERNENKINSTLGRMDVGRQFMADHPDATDAEMKAGVRAAMSGEGIWGFQTNKTGNDYYTAGKRGMSRFSATAGTDADPFIGQRSEPSFTGRDAGSDYVPNFTHYTPQYPANVPGSNTGTELTAQAVKEGILGAQEENRQKRLGSGSSASADATQEADADFDDLGNPRGWSRRRIDDALGEGGGGNRGGGGGRTPSWMDAGGGDIIRGIAGGSINSATGGAMTALSRTPWGMAAATAIGAVSIGNEVAENINEFIGTAEDAGVNNPNEYSSMSMGMQQLGLSEQQANRLNQTTHSAFNTLLNGDPSGAIRIVQGTRGLVTIGDIRSAQGDPVALARIIRERGAERGWSQARIAGAMEMAGLSGMARAANRSDYAQSQAESTVQAGRDSEYAEGIAANDTLQAQRGNLNVAQNALQMAVSNGAPVMTGARDAIIEARAGVSAAGNLASRAHDFIMGEESGGRDYDANGNVLTSSTGAQGRMQVLSSTNRDPGFGVRPAQDDSLEERARVGRDYYDAMVKRYNDPRKAMAAYTDGPGTVDKAVKDYGDDWLTHVPQQAQNRVAKYDAWVRKSGNVSEGADGFTRNGVSYGQSPTINVNINAKVNNQQASATVTSNGQTVNQTINMGNGANQRR